jgi:hypothetical protein
MHSKKKGETRHGAVSTPEGSKILRQFVDRQQKHSIFVPMTTENSLINNAIVRHTSGSSGNRLMSK